MFDFPVLDDYRRARDVLRRADFHFDAICETLGKDDWLTPRAMDAPTFERRTASDAPHDILIRLFLLGKGVPAGSLERALQPMSLEQWTGARLLRPPDSEGTVRSMVRLAPIGELLLASDTPRLDASEAPADFVMPPGATSIQLGWTVIEGESLCTLDLGTGGGYLGLVAAPSSVHIVGTDRNERAVMVSRFNALLNGFESFESRAGDLFEPVRNERFDRILSNPPFVITPHRRLMFRDSGMRGDEFCHKLIREAPNYLEEGGFCQLLANFPHRRGHSWRDELAGWFSGLECDALVMVTQRQRIDEYAMSWITATESQDACMVPKLFEEWMEFYEREQIEQVSTLHVTMRRGTGKPGWTHVDEDLVTIAGPCGDLIDRRFRILDILRTRSSDEALLDARLVLAPESRLVQEHVITGQGPRVAANRLEMRGGLRYSANLDVHVTRLLVCCDGQQPLRSVLHDMAKTLDSDLASVARIALPAVRHLMERGILAPA